MIYANLYIPH